MTFFNQIITAPTSEPVTLADMRAHLGITQTVDNSRDAIITARITTARQWAENYTGKLFITQTWGAYSDGFPGQPGLVIVAIIMPVNKFIRLRTPLQAVNSIQYVDQNGATQTMPSNQYLVDTIQGRICPAAGYDWPAVTKQPNAVIVNYTCGYGNAASNVPNPILDAIKFIVGQWEMFQSSIEGNIRPFTIPAAAKQLIDHYIDQREMY